MSVWDFVGAFLIGFGCGVIALIAVERLKGIRW